MKDKREQTIGRANVLPVSSTVLLPNTESTLLMAKADRDYAKHLGTIGETDIALPLKQGVDHGNLKADDFYRMGVLLTTGAISEGDDALQVQAQTAERIEVKELRIEGSIVTCTYEPAPARIDLDDKGREEILDYMKKVVHEIATGFPGGAQFDEMVKGYTDVDALIIQLARFMPLSPEERYGLLSADSLKERSLLFIDQLIRQKESLELNMRLNEKFSEEANKRYREQVLREQLKAIESELNSEDGETASKKDYRARIEASDMPDEVRKAALEEVGKLEASGSEGFEQSMIRNYLDFMLELPWKREEPVPVDLKAAREVLDARHYGLDKVKERIIQHLAVTQLKADKRGSVLLLVGPPGTGKTSLGKSIAEALGREYIRMSLGGIRDEAEIRGHRRTYVGAMPGRVLESIKRAGTTNPVMVLDEVDKIMPGGFSGDPASALLEVLDPEQNNTFTDHYLDLPTICRRFLHRDREQHRHDSAPLLDAWR